MRTPSSHGPSTPVAHTGNRLRPGDPVPVRTLAPVVGPPLAVPDPGRTVHAQFRRFAGCPVCHLHLRSVVRRHDEIERAGIREVVFFHSPAGELRVHADGLPFAVVADPGKELYREFGVEAHRRALLDPRGWPGIVRGVLGGAVELLRGRGGLPAASQPHGRTGLPADFLITPDGRIAAAKYGEHIDDQWSVDELLAHAAAAGATPG